LPSLAALSVSSSLLSRGFSSAKDQRTCIISDKNQFKPKINLLSLSIPALIIIYDYD